jgi:hypothetical protein
MARTIAMEQASMRIAMLLTVLALLLTAAPASADKQQWGFVISDRAVLLVYGVLESDSITLSFICEPKRKMVDIVTTVLPPKVKLGQAGKVRLSNGSSSLEFAGKVGRDNEESGEHFSAPTAVDPRLFDLLEKGTSIRIDALGAHDSVPLRRIKGPLAQMRNACR